MINRIASELVQERKAGRADKRALFVAARYHFMNKNASEAINAFNQAAQEGLTLDEQVEFESVQEAAPECEKIVGVLSGLKTIRRLASALEEDLKNKAFTSSHLTETSTPRRAIAVGLEEYATWLEQNKEASTKERMAALAEKIAKRTQGAWRQAGIQRKVTGRDVVANITARYANSNPEQVRSAANREHAQAVAEEILVLRRAPVGMFEVAEDSSVAEDAFIKLGLKKATAGFLKHFLLWRQNFDAALHVAHATFLKKMWKG